MDLPAMPKCTTRKGRHELCAIIPAEETGDLTLFCSHCGALRRVPVMGSPLASRLDDLTPAEIKRATSR